MNDERRLELERYFDEELPPDRRAEVARLLAGDDEARRHLLRLSRLRALARAHRIEAGRGVARPPRRRWSAAARAAAAALAASVAAVVLWPAPPALDVPAVPDPAPAPVAARPGSHPSGREVEAYTWANEAERNPGAAANAILRSTRRAERRPASAEILALNLANATPESARAMAPLALLQPSPSGGRGRAERHSRRTHSAASVRWE